MNECLRKQSDKTLKMFPPMCLTRLIAFSSSDVVCKKLFSVSQQFFHSSSLHNNLNINHYSSISKDMFGSLFLSKSYCYSRWNSDYCFDYSRPAQTLNPVDIRHGGSCFSVLKLFTGLGQPRRLREVVNHATLIKGNYVNA